jgi:hypothetical protein
MIRGLKGWLTGGGHLTGEELLAYLDGEVPARRRRHIEQHLRQCWACRVQSEGIEQAIAHFIGRRNEQLRRMPSPGGWAGFEARLERARREAASAWPVSRWWWRRDLRFSLATALASAAVLVIWLQLASAPKASASETLQRAVSVERQYGARAADPVVYQKIQLRRRAGGRLATASVETWSDLARSRQKAAGGNGLWSELSLVLRKNRLEGRPLLSAATYDAWRRGLREKEDRVAPARLRDGSEGLSIRTVSREPGRVDAIVRAELILRKQDWHPVEESLQVQGEREIREFELTEVDFDVTARSALAPSIFGDIPQPVPVTRPVAPPKVRVPAPPEPVRPDGDETELLALAALHRMRACLGEPVEIVRQASGLVEVRGLVETSERKEQIVQGLTAVPGLGIHIETVEEALRESSAGPPATAEAPPAAAELVRGGPVPLADRLKKHLSAPEITELSNRMVSIAGDLLMHAWALRRLDQAWPSERISRLPAPSRWLLEGMVREHALALRENAGNFRRALQAVRVKLPEPAADPAPDIVGAAQSIQSSTNRLFTGSDLPSDSADTVERELRALAGALQGLEAQSRRIEALAAGWSLAGSNPSHSEVRKVRQF